MNDTVRKKWDKRYNHCHGDFPQAAEVLLEHQDRLPQRGKALDLACGRGANAICLAQNGLHTSAWDISSNALALLSKQAEQKGAVIHCENRDVSQHPPQTSSFDVIVVSRFLDRQIIHDIKKAITPNGLVFYQTFSKRGAAANGPRNPDYLLDENELLKCFINWRILYYRETTSNDRPDVPNQSMLIARKYPTPPS